MFSPLGRNPLSKGYVSLFSIAMIATTINIIDAPTKAPKAKLLSMKKEATVNHTNTHVQGAGNALYNLFFIIPPVRHITTT